MVNWNHVLMGTVLAVLIWLILTMIIGASGYYVGFFIAALYIGYQVNTSNTNGAIHGALIGLSGGIIIGIIILSGLNHLLKLSWADSGPSVVIFNVLLFIIFASLGGLLGVNISKTKYNKSNN